MVTVNVTLTPGVDTDQTASAAAQIATCPSGTLASPNIINMPAGRYRIDGPLAITSKSHIRWTCAAGVQTYPNAPSDSQAFVAYTDVSWYEMGLSPRTHFTIKNCTNVIGSFMRIDGPNLDTWAPDYPGYAMYHGAGYESESAFAILNGSVNSGWVDCSWDHVHGDGLYAGGQNGGVPCTGCFVTRMTGMRAGRHNMCPVNVDGFIVTDFTGDWSGYSGIDVEPNSPLEKSWNITLTRMYLGSRVYAFSLTGGSPTHPSKKNISLIDCKVIRMAHTQKVGLFSRNESGGTLLVDGFVDLRNRNIYGADLTEWDNIIIRNSTIRSGINTAASYAVRVWVHDSLTITDNTFVGATEGFDNLLAVTGGMPPAYTHYGNVWAMGALDDGPDPVPPVALFAISKTITLVGGVATLTMAAVPPPGVTGVPYIAPFIGGAPFRLRSRKGWGRMRGAAGARLRGSQGPAERHPMRLRSPGGRGRLRSATHPSYLRSKQPISTPAELLSVTSGTVTLQGGVATLSSRLVATSGQLALHGTTATITIVNTVIVLPAVSKTITITGGDHVTGFRQAVTAGTFTLTGSATTLTRKLPATSAQIALAGGTALLSVRLAATSGTLTLAGSSAGLNGAVNFSATSGQMVLSGGVATLSIRTTATSKTLSLTGGTATLSLGKILHATPGELAILGGQAALSVLNRVGAGTITFTGGTAELSGTEILNFTATAGTVTIHGGTAHLTIGSPYPEWPMGELAPEWEMVG